MNKMMLSMVIALPPESGGAVGEGQVLVRKGEVNQRLPSVSFALGLNH